MVFKGSMGAYIVGAGRIRMAVTKTNDANIDGRTIKVMEAKPKEDRTVRNFNNGNSYNKISTN